MDGGWTPLPTRPQGDCDPALNMQSDHERSYIIQSQYLMIIHVTCVLDHFKAFVREFLPKLLYLEMISLGPDAYKRSPLILTASFEVNGTPK